MKDGHKVRLPSWSVSHMFAGCDWLRPSNPPRCASNNWFVAMLTQLEQPGACNLFVAKETSRELT